MDADYWLPPGFENYLDWYKYRGEQEAAIKADFASGLKTKEIVEKHRATRDPPSLNRVRRIVFKEKSAQREAAEREGAVRRALADVSMPIMFTQAAHYMVWVLRWLEEELTMGKKPKGKPKPQPPKPPDEPPQPSM